MATVTMTSKLSEDLEPVKFYDLKIMLDDAKIGYVEIYIGYDDDGDETYTFVKTIDIDEEHRNHGYGTQVLKTLADEHDGIYLCPDNDDAERLYARLGDEVDYAHCPDALEGEMDEYGTMYHIA